MKAENIKVTKDLIEFIESAPTAFHAVEVAAKLLSEAGFVRLSEGDAWKIVPGGKYYVTRNTSSILAFAVPEAPLPLSFMIMASHTDAPCFKLKTATETDAFGKYVKLNTEVYGGAVYSTWLDRPLSVAGRLILFENGTFTAKNVKVDRDLVLIPNVAIHQNRNLNSGYTYNAASDMMPLFGGADSKGSLMKIVAEAAGVDESAVVSADLYLYNRTPGSVWGADNEFYSCPGIDNRQCAYGTLRGFLDAVAGGDFASVPVYASFDNEETGNYTKQGAASPFLFDTLSRIAESFGADLRCALSSSFMVSADNGHAKHPNHPELYDGQNVPHLNEGVVIKSNAAQHYTTDALSAALFGEICRRAEVPTQLFANRSDMGSGGTLGSTSNTVVSLNTVDIGMAQLAMHSSYETGGTADTAYLIQASEAFYKAKIECQADGIYTLK